MVLMKCKPKADISSLDRLSQNVIYDLIYKLCPKRYGALSKHRLLNDAKLRIKAVLRQEKDGRLIAPDKIRIKIKKRGPIDKKTIEETADWLQKRLEEWILDSAFNTYDKFHLTLYPDELLKEDRPYITTYISAPPFQSTLVQVRILAIQMPGAEYEISVNPGEKVVIGTDEDCEVKILLKGIPARLLQIESEGTQLQLTVLTSGVKTWKSLTTLTPNVRHKLMPRDEIRFGDYFTLQIR